MQSLSNSQTLTIQALVVEALSEAKADLLKAARYQKWVDSGELLRPSLTRTFTPRSEARLCHRRGKEGTGTPGKDHRAGNPSGSPLGVSHALSTIPDHRKDHQ